MMVKKGKKESSINLPGKKAKKKQPVSIFSNIFFYVFLAITAYLVFSSYFQTKIDEEVIPISEVVSLVNNSEVQNILVVGDTINVQLRDGSSVVAEKESEISFDEILYNNNVDRDEILDGVEIKRGIIWAEILTPILSFLLPLLILLFIFRQMRGASGDIMSFGKSKARLFSKDISKISFKNVAGIDDAKNELLEVVDFLKNPEKYRKLGARIPRGILLVGPSGVGKTLLARAIAGEADVPYFSVAGSEFMEMLVGVGSARARDLFKRAKESQPALIFIDEIDAIGRQRGMGIGGGHDEREQTLNQILIEMDGFDPRTNVIVIAATNRPDMLDPALIRPGRFDRKIVIIMPDLGDREEIVKIHMIGKPFTSDVSVKRIAKRTVGFSGADIENMLNEAAILAARNGKKKISPAHVEDAALKVTMGSERKTLQTDDERKMVAYHEAGHALVASKMPEMDPVHQISIVARGASLGHTSLPPERDRYNETKTRLISLITTMLGGRAAEELVFNEMTVGASDDIDKVTTLSKKMVVEYGMSGLGPVSYNGKSSTGWLAREFSRYPSHSQEVAAKIDCEVKKIVDSAYSKAKRILSVNRKTLDRIAGALLDHETVRGEEYKKLLS